MIATFPMYDGPVAGPAMAAFWQAWREAIADAGIDAPSLSPAPQTSEELHAHWRAPDLFISQTCGFPYLMELVDHVSLIATPHYAVPGCEGPHYTSNIIVHRGARARTVEALAGTTVAINGRNSQSGFNALRAAILPFANAGPFFSSTLETGSHVASLEAVAERKADCAAIDCVSFAHIARDRPALVAEVETIAHTEAVPGLPFITSATRSDTDVEIFRKTLRQVLTTADLADVRQALFLSGMSEVPRTAYDLIRHQVEAAKIAGFDLSPV
ncbi:MAG: PhnD/SsuA/transferrin family substrate-binding protein [Pseudomonadota bacterium]